MLLDASIYAVSDCRSAGKKVTAGSFRSLTEVATAKVILALGKNLKTSVLAVILAVSGLATIVQPVQADEQGWVLTQKSQNLGDQYVYISPSGLKCVNPKAGFAMVTRAPDWNIVMFNDKTKVFFATTLDKYKRDLEAHGFTNSMSDKTWSKSGSTGNIAGLKATQYVMTGSGSNLQRAMGKQASSLTAADYWVSNDIAVPQRLSALLATAYGLPPTGNVPLRLDTTDAKGNRRLLDTYRMTPSAIPVSYFSCPAGYRQVQSDAEVMMTAEQKQMIDDMTHDSGGIDSAPSQPQAVAPVQSAPAATKGGAADELSKLLNAFNKNKK
jgi:hypothetical protein